MGEGRREGVGEGVRERVRTAGSSPWRRPAWSWPFRSTVFCRGSMTPDPWGAAAGRRRRNGLKPQFGHNTAPIRTPQKWVAGGGWWWVVGGGRWSVVVGGGRWW